MNGIIVGIIFLASLENVWPVIAGQLRTPPGFIFLGTIHHPADYFYYLSQFAQGGYRSLMTVNLFTSEPATPTFVGWNNVLIGKIFHTVGFTPVIAYHASVVLFTVLLFVAGFFLIRAILTTKPAVTAALYLFALFHAFPILRDGKPSYGDYWNNFAVPRVRFGGVPHQLLLNAASFIMVYFIIQWIQNSQYTRKTLAGIGLSSLVLASLQPVLWALIITTAGFSALCIYLTQSKLGDRSMTKQVGGLVSSGSRRLLFHRIGLPILVLMCTGLPPILYLTRLFSALPYSQLKLWEATAQNALTPEHFLTATGPIFLLALFTLPIFLSRITYAKLFVVIYSLASFILFLSPLPRLIGVSNARFMSTLTILSLSVIASYGVTYLLARQRAAPRVFGAALILGLFLLLIPNHFKTTQLTVSQFDPGNAYYYLPRPEYQFIVESGRLGKEQDTFLVTWPYNELFPALTGKRSYNGHPLITVNPKEKDAEAMAALNGSRTPEAVKMFFTDNHITYVIATTDNTSIASLPFLTRVTASRMLVLYRVK